MHQKHIKNCPSNGFEEKKNYKCRTNWVHKSEQYVIIYKTSTTHQIRSLTPIVSCLKQASKKWFECYSDIKKLHDSTYRTFFCKISRGIWM